MQHQWYCRIDGSEIGPLSAVQLRKLALAGTLSPDHEIRREDQNTWRRAATLKKLFESEPTQEDPARIVPVSGPDPIAQETGRRSSRLAFAVVAIGLIGVVVACVAFWRSGIPLVASHSAWRTDVGDFAAELTSWHGSGARPTRDPSGSLRFGEIVLGETVTWDVVFEGIERNELTFKHPALEPRRDIVFLAATDELAIWKSIPRGTAVTATGQLRGSQSDTNDFFIRDRRCVRDLTKLWLYVCDTRPVLATEERKKLRDESKERVLAAAIESLDAAKSPPSKVKASPEVLGCLISANAEDATAAGCDVRMVLDFTGPETFLNNQDGLIRFCLGADRLLAIHNEAAVPYFPAICERALLLGRTDLVEEAGMMAARINPVQGVRALQQTLRKHPENAGRNSYGTSGTGKPTLNTHDPFFVRGFYKGFASALESGRKLELAEFCRDPQSELVATEAICDPLLELLAADATVAPRIAPVLSLIVGDPGQSSARRTWAKAILSGVPDRP